MSCACRPCSCAPCAKTRPTPRCPAIGCWCAPATSAGPRPASTPGCRWACRVLRNIERIVREEMDAIGAQEVHFPALLPREPYEATGRWTEYGASVFRLQDRKGADYLLGPTHEEMFTLAGQGPVLLLQGPAAVRSTRSRPSTATRRGRGPGCCAAGSS